MILRVDGGEITMIYNEGLDLSEVGRSRTTRASYVEPAYGGVWYAALAPVGGPVLGPYTRRSEALKAEVAWIEQWLQGTAEAR